MRLAVDFKKGVGFKQTKCLEKSFIDHQSLLFSPEVMNFL